MKPLRQYSIFLLLISLLIIFAWLTAAPVSARPAGVDATPTPGTAPSTNSMSPHASGDCLGCHSKENIIGKTKNGETVSLSIVPIVHQGSFHNQEGMSCIICHEEQKDYPHKDSPGNSCSVCHWQMSGASAAPEQMIFDIPMEDVRAIGLNVAFACQKCHEDKADEVKGSAHTQILLEGNRFAPVCVDCHNGHDITKIDRIKIAQTCAKCHQAEYSAYKGSVHGTALEKDSNPDVPTCFDCHGAHKITGPREIDFRATMAEDVCGKCHSDKEKMDKYGISTDVLTTYMDDAHGHKDILGRLDNSSITKATCYDCHGIHNILSPKNPYSKVYPDNLQKTCAQCHKDAGITFPEAWLSHKKPSLSSMPSLYLANIASFGGVLLVIAVVLVFIILDIRRREGERTVARPKKD